MAIITPCRIIPTKPSDYFSPEEWLSKTRTLREIESSLYLWAKDHDLFIQSSSRWPTLSLSKRHVLTRRSVTLQLAPDYTPGDDIRWELSSEEIIHAWVFFYRMTAYRKITYFSDSEGSGLLLDSLCRVAIKYLVIWESEVFDAHNP